MKKNKVLYPKVMKGGAAVPLGNNFYYMKGKKHKDGGIDIGSDPKTGLEVEGEEVVQMTNKEVKVFSAQPFLNGKSPAQKVLDGEPATKVFNSQQNYKKINGINDDGTKKQNGGKTMIKNKFDKGGKKPIKRNTNILPTSNSSSIRIGLPSTFDTIKDDVDVAMSKNVSIAGGPTKIRTRVGNIINDVKDYYNDNPGTLGDTIGIAGNIAGSLISNRANNKMLDNLKYTKEPIAKQAVKLKTNININPQLDKMRESISEYERGIDNNTASSRVALARKQKVRSAGMLQTNELYGQKEYMETDLINKDKINQQSVAHSNNQDYNRWAEGKQQFDNTIAEKRSENTIGLVENLNSGIQDVITRKEKRSFNKENLIAIIAANPNVSPEILADLGSKVVTPGMRRKVIQARSKKAKKI